MVARIKSTMLYRAGKNSPNYHTVRLLHYLKSVSSLIPADFLWPPDLAPGGPDALEHGLI
jgi:hypothetical protein